MAESPYKFCTNCGSNEWINQSDREFVCSSCGYRHFITPIPAACALVLDSQDRLLVIRRAHQPGYGKLGLPGGVIEPDETGEMAAARETREETGLDVPAHSFTALGTLTNRYPFQGFPWPTIDLFYLARVHDFGSLNPDPGEVMETLICPLAEVPLDDFAFESNAEAVRRLQARQTSGRAL